MSSIDANVVFTEILKPLLRGSGNDWPAAALRIYGFPSCASVNTPPTKLPSRKNCINLDSSFREDLVLLQDAGSVFRLGDFEESDAFDGGHFQDSHVTNKRYMEEISQDNSLEMEIEKRGGRADSSRRTNFPLSDGYRRVFIWPMGLGLDLGGSPRCGVFVEFWVS
jgi:hypothetical protein